MRSSLVLVGIALMLPFLGTEPVTWAELWDPSSPGHRIFFELRLPRLALVLLSGGALAMLGGAYQSLFRNALADPYVLGISSATTLGIALSEIFLLVPAYSWRGQGIGLLSALLATLLLAGVGHARLARRPERLVLFGMGLNFVLSSALFLALSFHAQHIGGGSLRWLFGQIPWASTREVALFAALALPLVVVLLFLGRRLDAMSLGDGVARTLGVYPARARLAVVLTGSALLAVVVCFTGAIGFVGLVVPHGVRLVDKPGSMRRLLALSFVAGAVFLACSDVLSRVILPPFEFPIGVITTLLGGPLFLWLLWRRS